VPGGEREGTTPVCPACESERVEAIDPAASPLEYRCLDCGAEFDESGGRIAVE
jgi:transposase-like protein